MTDDDTIHDPFSLPDDNAHPSDIAARLMRLPEHKPLAEHEVRFGYLMRSTPKEKGGKTELGSVHSVKTMFQGGFKDLGMQLLEKLLGGPADYLMVINGPWWSQASARDREALVYHELLHVRQATDNYGTLKFDKDGYPVWRLVQHDVEVFTAEVRRYGDWTGEIAPLLDAARGAV